MLSSSDVRMLRDALLRERSAPDVLPHETFGLTAQIDVVNFILGVQPEEGLHSPETQTYFRDILDEQKQRVEDLR